jgi:hypothetical protein
MTAIDGAEIDCRCRFATPYDAPRIGEGNLEAGRRSRVNLLGSRAAARPMRCRRHRPALRSMTPAVKQTLRWLPAR